ncbi:MAG: hypothetical protein HOG73_08685 [Candidatus Marinimicrobia bacterium]|jgi:hypothetical protein|nr:hypothetical protein [Candidatus Neomarinimicrobiota bacterium]MBT4735597.1 hypothetical protein [Candidatus Neomarinimicrobiota bacterium]MBT5760597.1 hypothetical protein [Candidatus Neomarinimicrobiota bacterium]MBT5995782.1 hypothetical protein [Candidatus Neomarinimicrobiota bacterium]
MNKILLLLSLSLASAQLNYTGEINPSVMTRTSDQSQINLPFRIMSLDLGYTIGSLDIKTVSAVEYRYDSSKSTYDLREAYLAYYPEWGEIKFGKQIHAWGAVDGNNPTDNLNPYDYYYLFKAGVGQKIGTLSLSSKLYFGNYQMEGVFIPKHAANRIPYGEKDYPLALPLEPNIEYPVQDEIEIGFRIQTSIGEADFGVSIFKGNDRTPSISTIKYITDVNPNIGNKIIPQLGYRTTTVWGLDFVTFFGDFTLRGEGAIFKTQTPLLKLNLFKIPTTLYELHQDIVYSQFVLQGEYTTVTDIILAAQLIGNKVGKENYEWYHSLSKQLVDFPKLDKFRPGMGTPFAMFSELVLILSSSGVLMDDRLELKGNAMINLDKKGVMLSASVGYSPWMNWKFELGLVQFKGDKDDLESSFTKMENFSHTKLGLFYNF